MGYEFWLAQQAKARNPNIKLYGLAWGAPGWIGGGNFWSTDTINYLVSWLGCAHQHGLTIDYLGGWNERGYNVSWYENLRSALNSNGYSAVRIVAADSDWSVANDVDSNPTFAAAVSVIGAHYPCGYRSSQTNCAVPSDRLVVRQAAVGQRERLGRLQRRRAGDGPRHQPRLHRRQDDRVPQLAGDRRDHPEPARTPPWVSRWLRSRGRATTRSARTRG